MPSFREIGFLTRSSPDRCKGDCHLNSIAPHPGGNCKLDELRLLLSNPGKDCHILGITETWLNSNFKNSEIHITGYCVERLDRSEINLPFIKRGGGGIAAYIDKSIPYVRRKDLESKSLETLWIKLCPPKRPAHLICFAYRCPQYDITMWLKEFECQMTEAYLEGCQLMIMGDFNVDLLANNAHVKSWLDLVENSQLLQIINEPTRVSSNSTTLVDHVFTSSYTKVRAVKVPKIGLSDHYPTCVVFKENFGSKHRHTSIKYRSFKNFDQDKFFNDLNRCPWDSIEETNDIEHNLEIWYNLLTGVVDKHLRTKTKRVKRTKQPEWMTHDILECMRDRDHCKSVKDYVAYKILRNKCVSLIRQAKTIFYQSCIKNSKGDSSKLWKHIRSGTK